MFLWCVKMGGEAYTKGEDFFFQELGVPTLAPPCKLVRDASDRLRVPHSTPIPSTLSKSDRVVLIM